MTTRFEQIAAAFPLHAQRIAELCCENDQREMLFSEAYADEAPTSTLMLGFNWSDTSEGPDYWCALYDGTGFVKTC